MDNDLQFGLVFASVVMICIGVVGYGSYRLGAITERKAYTASFISQVETAYWEGYTDALNGLKRPSQ
jgi:hypothetical protein